MEPRLDNNDKHSTKKRIVVYEIDSNRYAPSSLLSSFPRDLSNMIILEKLEHAKDNTIVWNDLTVTVSRKTGNGFLNVALRTIQRRRYEESLVILKGGDTAWKDFFSFFYKSRGESLIGDIFGSLINFEDNFDKFCDGLWINWGCGVDYSIWLCCDGEPGCYNGTEVYKSHYFFSIAEWIHLIEWYWLNEIVAIRCRSLRLELSTRASVYFVKNHSNL